MHLDTLSLCEIKNSTVSIAAVVGNGQVVNSILVYCGTMVYHYYWKKFGNTGSGTGRRFRLNGRTVLRLSYENTTILGAVMCSLHGRECGGWPLRRSFLSHMSTDTTTNSAASHLSSPSKASRSDMFFYACSEHAPHHRNTGRLRGAVTDCINSQKPEPIEAPIHIPAKARCGLAQPCATAWWLPRAAGGTVGAWPCWGSWSQTLLAHFIFNLMLQYPRSFCIYVPRPSSCLSCSPSLHWLRVSASAHHVWVRSCTQTPQIASWSQPCSHRVPQLAQRYSRARQWLSYDWSDRFWLPIRA